MRIEGPFIPSNSLPQGDRYTTKLGDTLQSVAKHFNVATQELADANQLDAKQPLQAGMQLSIPAASKPAPSQIQDRFEQYKPGSLDSMMSTPKPATSTSELNPTASAGEIAPFQASAMGELIIKPALAGELLPNKPAVSGEIMPLKPAIVTELLPAEPALSGELMAPAQGLTTELLSPSIAGEILPSTQPQTADVGELLPTQPSVVGELSVVDENLNLIQKKLDKG